MQLTILNERNLLSLHVEFDGVITLNEPYKTLVPTSLYRVSGFLDLHSQSLNGWR